MTEAERWERARMGDPSERVLLTFEAIKDKRGFLVTWAGAIEGCVMVWISFKKRRKVLLRAVAAQNLQDVFELVQRHKGPGWTVEIFDLATGASLREGLHSTNVGATFSLEPPKGSPFRKSRVGELT